MSVVTYFCQKRKKIIEVIRCEPKILDKHKEVWWRGKYCKVIGKRYGDRYSNPFKKRNIYYDLSHWGRIYEGIHEDSLVFL